MKKKKIIIPLIIVILLLIIVLWFNGVIPKQIAKVYGTSYVKSHFPKMNLEYVNIEWSKFHGDYLITFRDKENEIYGCAIGPKYFPISMGQGIFALEETYRKLYGGK